MSQTQPKYKRHGGPWDRGSADFWYARGAHPHYFVGGSYKSDSIPERDMSDAQIRRYHAGYAEAEELGAQKDWG